MKPLDTPALTAEYVEAVATLYRATQNVRLRTRAQMVLLAAEQTPGAGESFEMSHRARQDHESTSRQKGSMLRRQSFDSVATDYDRYRTPYPQTVVDAAITLSNLQRGSRVLEIGCGTGQLSIPAGQGWSRPRMLRPPGWCSSRRPA